MKLTYFKSVCYGMMWTYHCFDQKIEIHPKQENLRKEKGLTVKISVKIHYKSLKQNFETAGEKVFSLT